MTIQPSQFRLLRSARLEHWRRLLAEIAPAQRLLAQVNDGSGADELDYSWKRRNKIYPYSCTDEEGLILHFVIAQAGLRSGFEIATAFGYSTLFAATALHRNGGRIRTMDCYVEEKTDNFDYEPEQMKLAVAEVRRELAQGKPPDGLELAKRCATESGVLPAIDYFIGLSPDDVPTLLHDQAVDYALIDGGHFGDQPSLDFRAVRPYLAPRCAVFFHDNLFNPSISAAISEAEAFLGTPAHRFNTKYGLTLVARGLEPEVVAKADALCIRNLRSETQIQKFKRRLKRLVGMVFGKP